MNKYKPNDKLLLQIIARKTHNAVLSFSNILTLQKHRQPARDTTGNHGEQTRGREGGGEAAHYQHLELRRGSSALAPTFSLTSGLSPASVFSLLFCFSSVCKVYHPSCRS